MVSWRFSFTCVWVPREANSVAHSCVSVVSSTKCSFFWLDTIPDCLIGLPSSECTPTLQFNESSMILKKTRRRYVDSSSEEAPSWATCRFADNVKQGARQQEYSHWGKQGSKEQDFVVTPYNNM
jgi:hypothetical protein